MALTRTWETKMNQSAFTSSDSTTRAKQSFWSIFSAMTDPALTGKWTSVGESNGSTGGMGTTGILDRATFQVGQWNPNTPAAAHSWFCLQSPGGLAPGGGSLFLTFSYNYSSAWPEAHNVYMTYAIPTGGGASADPTFPSPSFDLAALSSLSFQYNLGFAYSGWRHVIMASTGEFWLMSSPDAVNAFTQFLSLQRMDSLRTGDTQDVLFGGYWQSLGSQLNNTQIMEYWFVRSSDGSTRRAYVMQPSYGNARSEMLTTYNTDITEGVPLSYPVYLFVPEVTQRTLKGRVVDLQLTFGNPADGTLQPAVSPFERVVMSRFWLPGSASPVF